MSGTGRSFAQVGATIVGLVYVVVGVVGFAITGFDGFVKLTGHSLVGFDLNPFHNVVHLGIGAYLLFAARMDSAVTEGALIGGGLVYVLAAFLGFTNNLQLLSIDSSTAPDNFLHIVSGVAAIFIGLVSASSTNRKRAGDPVEQR